MPTLTPLANHAPRSAGTADTLRVCHVMTADLWAGAETQVATIASYLVKHPEVTLTAVLLNEGWLSRELRTLGVELAVVDERRHSAAQIVRAIARFLREHDVQLVHTHRYKDTVLGAIAARIAGVPHFVRTVHGLAEPVRGVDLVKSCAYDALDKAALWSSADRILAVSERMADTLRTSGYKASIVGHLHNGIDIGRVHAVRSRSDVRKDLGLDDDAVVVGTAGRFSRVKGHEFLVRAARSIRRQEPNARFLFVGTGPLKGELLTSAAELGIDDACLFIDPAIDPRSSVYDLIAAMDVFVLPSVNEGIPMALLEAMALARPIVASAVGGVPEVVFDRVTGLLVAPCNPDVLSRACLELLRNRPWAQTLGVRARRRVERKFTSDRQGDALLEAYQAIVGNGMMPQTVPRSSSFARIAESVREKIRQMAERRRMRALRRNPADILASMRSARRMLIVCHGNIIRSAFASRLLTDAVAGRPDVTICSAGLEATPGRPAHPIAVRVAGAFRIDLRNHRAARVTASTVADADVILVMDLLQLVRLKSRFPGAAAKAFLFSTLAPREQLEVSDPVLGDEAMFRSCFEHISRAARPLIQTLSDRCQ